MSKIQKTTTTNHYAMALLNQAGLHNIDTDWLLATAGIEKESITSPGKRVITENIARLVQLMWDAMQDENMMLNRSVCKKGSFYMMGKLTVPQPNLGKALLQGFKFYDLLIAGYKLSLVVDDKKATIILKQQDLEMDPDHLLTELVLIAWHRYSSWLIGEHIILNDASFSYEPPLHIDEYKYLFPCVHHFGQDQISFSFSNSYLKRTVVQNLESLKIFMSRCPVELFIKHRSDDSFTSKVTFLLERKATAELPDLSSVAKMLNMSPQTLRRKLKVEGTSFQQIIDLVRRDVAIFHLTQQGTSVGEIAQLVGFSDSGVFVRAFKKWTGTTPGAYRILNQSR